MRGQLLKLSELIQSTVADIIAEYDAAGVEVPDLSFGKPGVAGPFDAPEKASERLLRAICTVEAACGQLCASVVSPALVLTNVRNRALPTPENCF